MCIDLTVNHIHKGRGGNISGTHMWYFGYLEDKR